jgi:hypothetical protein
MDLKSPGLWAFLSIFALSLVGKIVAESWWPWDLAKDSNGKLSASKLQIWIWTAVTLASYCAVVAARFGHPPDGQEANIITLPQIPVNLLVLMGLAAATTAGSRAITVSYLEQDRLPKTDQSTLTKNLEGQTDLTKVQMLIWTLVGAVVYSVQVSHYVGLIVGRMPPGELALPDVDGALLVLMGAAQGAYIGGKLVSSSSGPFIDQISPQKVQAADPVTITVLGTFFGSEKQELLLTPAKGPSTGQSFLVKDSQITNWTATRIDFTLPAATRPTDQPTQTYLIQVRVAGQLGAPRELIVEKTPVSTTPPPAISTVLPSPVITASPASIAISGRGFGSTKGTVRLYQQTTGTPLTLKKELTGTDLTAWDDATIRFNFPPDLRPTDATPVSFDIVVVANGRDSAVKQIEVHKAP